LDDRAGDKSAGVRASGLWASGLWASGLGLIILVTLARTAYLAWACPYTLIEDEAHYWEWSRRLELSYYSKGPGIAWLIRAATELCGTHEWSIRLPAVLSGALGAWCVAGLARDICRDRRAGLHAAAVYVCMPAFWVLSILVTIDGPYLACWAGACWAGWRALTRGSRGAWACLGLAIGAGFVVKYTILLLVPGLVIAWWLGRKDRDRPAGLAGPALALACAALGLIPVLLWNATHGWITVRHLLGHLGVAGGDVASPKGEGWSPVWVLELLGTQLALAGPAILLGVYGFVCARRAYRRCAAQSEAGAGPECHDPEVLETWRAARYLACCGLPVLLFYLAVSLIAEPEGNWPIAAWVSAAPLGAIAVAGVMPEYRRRLAAWREKGRPGIRPHMHRVMAWRWTVGLGVIVALGFARADWLARLPVVGPIVPRGRLMLADVRAADALRILGQLRAETGLEPVVMAQHYGRTSQLAYYLPGRPVVYCAGAYMEGPRKQYDLWPETNLSDEATHAALLGRPALLVGGRFEQWAPAFELVADMGQLEGEHKKGRLIYLGYGYRGFGGAGAQEPTQPAPQPAPQPNPAPAGSGA
jgi:hypothetical protein